MEEYNRFAAFYDLFIEPLVHSIRKDFSQLVKRLSPSLVVDLGCGTGKQISMLPGSAKAFGIDISLPMLLRAKKRVPNHLLRGNVVALPLRSDRIELAYSQFALHEKAPEVIAEMLEEIRRILRPGGLYCVVDFARGKRGSIKTGFARRAISLIEKHAGEEHYTNYQLWMAAGGLDCIRQRWGWRRLSSKEYFFGSVRMDLFQP